MVKVQHTCRQRQGMIACNNHNMRNPISLTSVKTIWGYACYDCCMLPLSACMLNFDLVSILFGTSIPTSFNILVKMFLHLCIYIYIYIYIHVYVKHNDEEV